MSAAAKSGFKSREEFKKAKELEEARKAGTVAPEVDEDGNDINPHIPQYISQAPWYVPTSGPTLRHQRNLREADRKFDKLGSWYARGERAGPAATTFRKGACENCGAMTHKRKDCLERPRARGAKWSGTDIVADDVVGEVNLDWEGKRDRWNGYQPQMYKGVQERFAKLEAERQRLRAETLDRKLREGKGGKSSGGVGLEDSDDDDDDGDVVDRDGGEANGDAQEVVMQQRDQSTPATVRNLRIREDTAKYLRNLDVDSAYYDPKTRSMRADPNPGANPEDKDYAGDNFVRYSGDVKDLARMELHSLKASENGRDLPHLLGEPTTAEQVFKDFASRKNAVEERRRKEVIERYGGEEHFKQDERIKAVQQSEAYVEYNHDGQVVRGKESARPVSKYPEDVFENKHTSVWGSYYINGRWGYQCCHQTTRNAYCTGEQGKRAAREIDEEMEKRTAAALKVRFAEPELKPADDNDKVERAGGSDVESPSAKRRKLAAALEAHDAAEGEFEGDDRKRGYNSSKALMDVTEEDMESYRLRKRDAEDPMFHALNKSGK